jgi:hypothetical protein
LTWIAGRGLPSTEDPHPVSALLNDGKTELMPDVQTYEYVMITADLAFGRLPPTATQWIDEVQLTAVGISRVGMLDGRQFTPPSVEMKA